MAKKIFDHIYEKVILSAHKYWRSGGLSVLRWLRERSGRKKYMTFRANDPGPFIASINQAVHTMTTSFIRNLVTC